MCFMQVGVYDPYGDDLQLSIHKSVLSCSDETLFVSGSSGQVIVLNFSTTERQLGVKVNMLIEVFPIMCKISVP
jgi:hypothetical protein